jgi:ABC-type nickel/cobalt efflux system permease component RcnA
LVFITAACSSKKEDTTVLVKAAEIHNAMMRKSTELQHSLNRLEKFSEVPADSVALWSSLLDTWKKDVVEVPGNEAHSHDDHDHDHHHHGHANENLTPEQVLAIQQDLDKRLDQLIQRTGVAQQ